VSDTALAVVLALGAGLCYSIAAVLQQRVAAQQAPELSLSPRLIVELVQRPVWLLGIAFDVTAYLLEAAALGVGSIVVVGPLLVSGLLFAIPLASIGTGARVSSREMVPAVMVTAGLALFVVVGSPEGGSSRASTLGWAVAGLFVAVVAGIAVTIGRRSTTTPNHRALLFGLATGTLYGLTAVLTKATVDLFGDGIDGVLGVLGHWEPYALITVSIAGLILNQSAFQAGHVAASLPVIAVANPVLSCTFGVVLFGETLGAHGPLAWTVTALSIVAMTAGTILLAQSPLVAHEVEHVPAIEV
jgi:drug/metabolite transporter (DMT)-like permease